MILKAKPFVKMLGPQSQGLCHGETEEETMKLEMSSTDWDKWPLL